MLEAQHISVRYGDRTVVHDLSFTLSPGQWLMLVGPNGAGKSTLVRALSQLVPYEGTFTLNGQDLKTLKPSERASRIGVLSQQHHAEYAYTVEEIVSLGRYAHTKGFLSTRKTADTEAITDALQKTGMTAYRHTSLLNLSGGEIQRAFLSQVFAQSPQLMILDEPANHLDLKYQKDIFSLLTDWLRQENHAILSVVHDLSLARMFGTHALLMQEGTCLAQGPIETVLSEDNLRKVYDMDVVTWMKGMYQVWSA